jgi:hypothetical protein
VRSSWLTAARAVVPVTVTSLTFMSVSATSRSVAFTSSTQSRLPDPSDLANSSVSMREQISSGSREPLRSSMTCATSCSAPLKSPADAFGFAAAQPVSAAVVSNSAINVRRRMEARG